MKNLSIQCQDVIRSIDETKGEMANFASYLKRIEKHIEFNKVNEAITELDKIRYEINKIKTNNIKNKSQDIKVLDPKTILYTIGEFNWCWGQDFFVETEHGNFHWKDPDYNGDNTFTLFHGDLKAFYKEIVVEYGRDKGKHRIFDYCGDEITIVLE